MTLKNLLELLRDIAYKYKENAEKALAEIQKIQAEDPLHNTIDPKRVQVLQQLVSVANRFITSLDSLVDRFDLKTNYIENVRNYVQTVKNSYDTFQISNVKLIAPETDQTLLLIVSSMGNLFPCFYRMESITRYPLSEFSYENLDLLANQKQACNQIAEMLGDLFTILRPYLMESNTTLQRQAVNSWFLIY